MAKKKRHSAAEIAAKLLEADGLSAKGQTQAKELRLRPFGFR
jgi:hypothetical protein